MIHVVRAGESLDHIARTYDVSAARLRSDNGLTADQVLVPGQALVVVEPTSVYTVQPGEGLYQIAGATGVSVTRLLQLNQTVSRSTDLRPGELLTTGAEGQLRGPLTVGGYAYPHIRPAVLARALPFLTDLSVFAYGFREDGSLVVPDDAALLAEAARYGAGAVLVLTSIDESGTFSTARASRLFRETQLQDRVLGALLDVMEEKGYRGLDADFEYIAAEDAAAYLTFLGHARDLLHARGLFLHVDLAPKTYAGQPGLLYVAHDYAAIGAIADSVLVMSYEWGYAYGPPMAVAPLPQVEAVLRYAVTEIPSWKVLMGVPNYGYDWLLPYEQGRRATTLGNEEAVRLASRMGAEIRFDEGARAPNFSYRTDGQEHVVWFEDARSIRAKLDLAVELGLAGIAYWNLLRPFSQNWAYLSTAIAVRPTNEAH